LECAPTQGDSGVEFEDEQFAVAGHRQAGRPGPPALGGDLDWIMLVTRLRATGMSVKDMQRYAELVRAGGGEQERLELLTGHRRRVRAALAEQQECLQMLDAKIRTYRRTVRSAAKENTDA
jgi:hypothetical protein